MFVDEGLILVSTTNDNNQHFRIRKGHFRIWIKFLEKSLRITLKFLFVQQSRVSKVHYCNKRAWNWVKSFFVPVPRTRNISTSTDGLKICSFWQNQHSIRGTYLWPLTTHVTKRIFRVRPVMNWRVFDVHVACHSRAPHLIFSIYLNITFHISIHLTF